MKSEFGMENKSSADNFDENGIFDFSDVREAIEEFNQELDFDKIYPKNIALIWNLPPVLDLVLLRDEFLAECKNKVPKLSLISTKIKSRTDKVDKWVKNKDPNGNPNVLLCSYILVAVRQREKLFELIGVWDQKMFQTKKLSAKLSKFDGGDDQ
ncbi:hypothetical protein niasHS_007634 [Heterodera schachtii]|uniref:Uncharacterized protein n=1 Tax=Heterodera schachtii TaxID=97005 RepID=A0ABD2JPC0_HETSC